MPPYLKPATGHSRLSVRSPFCVHQFGTIPFKIPEITLTQNIVVAGREYNLDYHSISFYLLLLWYKELAMWEILMLILKTEL
jgi:hypothetical protein